LSPSPHYRFVTGTAHALGCDRVARHFPKEIVMAYVVCEPCRDCKYTDCVVVCPMDCFYQDEGQLYIDPEECIDCEACVPECPVDAIHHDQSMPPAWEHFVQLNAERVAVLKPRGGHISERQEPQVGAGCRERKS
jgi:ferredoxin